MPTDSSADPPRRQRSTWPTVLGAVAIGLGAAGVLRGFLGLATRALLIIAWMGEDWHDPLSGLRLLGLALAGAALGTGVLLIFAGHRLLLRAAGADRLIQTWAWLAIGVAAVDFVHEGLRLRDDLNQMRGGGTDAIVFTVTVMTTAWSFLLALAPPIFAVIWFRREKIVAEMLCWPPRDRSRPWGDTLKASLSGVFPR